MTQQSPDLESEFAYHKYKLDLVEECRQNLSQIQQSLEGVSNTQTLRSVAVYFAKESFERCVEIYDYTIVAKRAVIQYKTAVRAVEFLLLMVVLTNLITGFVVWLILH